MCGFVNVRFVRVVRVEHEQAGRNSHLKVHASTRPQLVTSLRCREATGPFCFFYSALLRGYVAAAKRSFFKFK